MNVDLGAWWIFFRKHLDQLLCGYARGAELNPIALVAVPADFIAITQHQLVKHKEWTLPPLDLIRQDRAGNGRPPATRTGACDIPSALGIKEGAQGKKHGAEDAKPLDECDRLIDPFKIFVAAEQPYRDCRQQ